MRGKKTDIETKAKIADLRINKGMLGSDIASELDIPERTVNKIIDTDIAEVCRESDLILDIIRDATEASKVMGAINLHMAKDIRQRQIQVDDGAEGFKPTTDEIRTLNTTVDSAFKRAQLLGGKATERIDIGDYSNKTQKELEEIRKQQLL